MPIQTPESSLPRVHLSAVGYGGEDAWVPVARYNTPQETGADLGPLFVFLHEGMVCGEGDLRRVDFHDWLL